MTAFTLTVESDDLARIMTNALAFFPARSQVKTALLQVDSQGTLTATGTDTYTVGRDWCEAREVQAEWVGVIPIELDRDGWRDIEAQARKDKGNTATLEYTPGDALIFRPGGPKADKGVAQDVTGKDTTYYSGADGGNRRSVWELCDELLTRLEGIAEHRMTFDPALFGRFQKVKAPKDWDAEKVLDFCYQGQVEPMLAKVGPSFVGAVMPIDRDKYAIQQGEPGQEGLW